jgi:heptosyltransferase-2
LLVRGVNWLGDAVMTMPALQRLREALPGAHITLLTHEKLADLWLNHQSLNCVVPFAAHEGVGSVAKRLRAENFQCALILPNSPRSAFEVWLAGIPRRIGYRRPWRNWSLTEMVQAPKDRVSMRKRSVREIKRLTRGSRSRLNSPATRQTAHQTNEYLHLVAALGANPAPVVPRLDIRSDELESVSAKFGLGGAAAVTRPIFALNPGAEYGPAKRWPLERFIAAAQEVHNCTRCVWLILGGQADAPVAAQIESAIRSRESAMLNLAGKTSLRELCVLLKFSRVLLTNDSGPMHVAAAVGTPVVVPFGSTSAELTGPGLPGDPRHGLITSDVPCAPCFRRSCPIDFRCMIGISVQQIVEAVLRVAASS